MSIHFTQFLSNFNTILYKIRLQYNLILLCYFQFIFKSFLNRLEFDFQVGALSIYVISIYFEITFKSFSNKTLHFNKNDYNKYSASCYT